MQDPAVLAFDPFISAENAVNERLAQTPELYLLALAQFATAADTEVVSMLITLEPACCVCLRHYFPMIPSRQKSVFSVTLPMDDHSNAAG